MESSGALLTVAEREAQVKTAAVLARPVPFTPNPKKFKAANNLEPTTAAPVVVPPHAGSHS